MDIMDFFPYPEAREGQRLVLSEVQRRWNDADVFVINVPTAGGKTAISLSILRWANACCKLKGVYTAPTNILVDQFIESFPKSASLHRKAHYHCIHKRPIAENCGVCPLLKEKRCPESPYLKAVRRAHVVPWLVCNTYTYLAHKLYAPVAIFDEGHGLISIAQDRMAKVFWHKDYGFPISINSYGSLLNWLERLPEEVKQSPKIRLLAEEIQRVPPRYLVQKSVELLRNEEELCLKLLPLDVSDKCGFLWPKSKNPKKSVQKIILLSATINEQDIESLGLSDKRVVYLETPSPIPVERRPIAISRSVNMSYATQDRDLPKLADIILSKLAANVGKGFIHTTYGLSEKLRKIPELRNHPRLMWHDRENRTEVYSTFKHSDTTLGKVLIACGMEEGVSLDYEIATWQLLTKVPYPSLADPATRHKANEQPLWYQWETLKKVIQAAGRICRTPTDFGSTEIVDSCMLRLLESSGKIRVPSYFLEGIQEVAEVSIPCVNSSTYNVDSAVTPRQTTGQKTLASMSAISARPAESGKPTGRRNPFLPR